MADGYKRGTNYNHKMAPAPVGIPRSVSDVLAARADSCADGEHRIREADDRVHYAPFGRRREPGERWCEWCQVIFGPEETP